MLIVYDSPPPNLIFSLREDLRKLKMPPEDYNISHHHRVYTMKYSEAGLIDTKIIKCLIFDKKRSKYPEASIEIKHYIKLGNNKVDDYKITSTRFREQVTNSKTSLSLEKVTRKNLFFDKIEELKGMESPFKYASTVTPSVVVVPELKDAVFIQLRTLIGPDRFFYPLEGEGVYKFDQIMDQIRDRRVAIMDGVMANGYYF